MRAQLVPQNGAGSPVIKFEGALTSKEAWAELEQALLGAAGNESEVIALDLWDVPSISSEGLTCLLKGYKELRNHGKLLTLRPVRGEVREKVETLMLDCLIPVEK